MDIYIISSLAHFKQLKHKKHFFCGFAGQRDYIFATRDWFAEREIEKSGYDVVILDDNLNKSEIEKLTREEMEKLSSWYKCDGGKGFSFYRGVSLADSAIQHFYHDVFSHIFSFIPNIQKLIHRFSPQKIIYEYHLSYRNSLYFNLEDKILKLVCDHYGIEFSCIYSDRFDEMDRKKYHLSEALKRKKDAMIRRVVVGPIKGMVIDVVNYIQIYVKHRFKQIIRKRPCIFTDSSRGTNYFQKYWQNKYNFIQSRRLGSFWTILQQTTYLAKSYRDSYKKNEIVKIKKKWERFLGECDASHFTYFGIDLCSYFKEEVDWAIDNIFPRLMELIDKGIWLFANAKIDALFFNGDTTIESRYLHNIAKMNSLPNFNHPDGLRNTIGPENRHADYKLLFSTEMVRDFQSEGLNNNLYVVGNPWFQVLYQKRMKIGLSMVPKKKWRILIGAKNEGAQILGNSWSSGNRFLEDILKGIYPLHEFFEVTVRNFPGRSNFLPLLQSSYFQKYPFVLQFAEKLPFEEMIEQFDIFIMKWTTALYEAAIMDKIVIFFSNNNVFSYAPFDGKSELTRVNSPEQLTRILRNILNGKDEEYRAFNNKNVLEKYTGPLERPFSIMAMEEVISKYKQV